MKQAADARLCSILPCIACKAARASSLFHVTRQLTLPPTWGIAANGDLITATIEEDRASLDKAYCREARVLCLPHMTYAGNGHSRRINARLWLPYHITRKFHDQLTRLAAYKSFHVPKSYNITLLDHIGHILRPTGGP
ncbi:hypothetical protein NLG97_g10341 [Lecanicillium saksenae]|uniref:Uncharacterized protein n=1 Tax=Lecanicillium saksenae TaxID=468837 RepID=A0ACC1QDG3_9HYPO|nr:hypothetical protein NLG97_g10341 [Lecanicillium saksenae]